MCGGVSGPTWTFSQGSVTSHRAEKKKRKRKKKPCRPVDTTDLWRDYGGTPLNGISGDVKDREVGQRNLNQEAIKTGGSAVDT